MERVTSKRIDEFLARLRELGGVSLNERLRKALAWDEQIYWRAQGKLIEDGRIAVGPGRGGSVRLAGAEIPADLLVGGVRNGIHSPAEADVASETRRRKASERPLYGPIAATIQATWIKRFAFDEVMVEETHSRGSKATGGTFTRPDITVAGIRRYVFLPKRLEIVTFEIKPVDSVDVMGVLEAIAHREAAHRSYVLYATSRPGFEGTPEAERIIELAQKYGSASCSRRA